MCLPTCRSTAGTSASAQSLKTLLVKNAARVDCLGPRPGPAAAPRPDVDPLARRAAIDHEALAGDEAGVLRVVGARPLRRATASARDRFGARR
jgi:hypothetical protein